MTFLRRIAAGLKGLVGLVLPMFSKARQGRGMSPAVRWGLHLVLVLLILIGLGVLNYALGLEKYLSTRLVALRSVWLPLLFALFYVLCWLSWSLWKLLGPEQESSDFPDVDAAWAEACRSLDSAGIDLTETPLFLVLGRPATAEETLFQAAGMPLDVAGVPRRSDAPVRVFANRDGVYVTCSGASLLGRQAALYAETGGPGSIETATPVEAPEETFATIAAGNKGEGVKSVEAILSRAREQGRGMGQLLDEEKRAIGLLVASEETSSGRARPSIFKNKGEADLLSARLHHLCRLIVRDRRPFCPINGILVLLPMASCDSDDDASQAGTILQRDLASARDVFRLVCPVFVVVTELEALPGFRQLIERLPEGQKERRMGQRFPLVPDLEPSAVPSMIESGVQWIGNKLFPDMIDKLWRVEAAGGADLTETVEGNVQLYQLLRNVRDRQKRLSRILIRGTLVEGAPPMLGGCYLVGTGPDPARQQAFVPGVFRRLTESQDYISWTRSALAEDTDYSKWTTFGYAGLVVTIIVSIGVGILLSPK